MNFTQPKYNSQKVRKNVLWKQFPLLFPNGSQKNVSFLHKIANKKQMYINPHIDLLPNGLYSFLIESKNGVIFTKFIPYTDALEFGTKHMYMRNSNNSSFILAAGELKKSCSSITFNLQSGTFSKKIINNLVSNGFNNSILVNVVKSQLSALGSSNHRFTSNNIFPSNPVPIHKLPSHINTSRFTLPGHVQNELKLKHKKLKNTMLSESRSSGKRMKPPTQKEYINMAKAQLRKNILAHLSSK